MLQDTFIRERSFSPERLMAFSPWSAIIAGAIAAASVQITLAVLGVALGATAPPNASVAQVGWAAGAWWFVTGLLSLAAGGALTGYLHPAASGCIRAINGFLAWCVLNVAGASAFLVAGGTAWGGSLSTLVPVHTAPYWASGATDAVIRQGEPMIVASPTLWLPFLALLLGATASWMASWWVGGFFNGRRVTASHRSTAHGLPPMPGAPVT